MSKQKFYTEDQAGISFETTRKIGDVRIPNYVYDIWVPLLGIEAIGVYAVYCRLERHGAVKAMSLKKLAASCRIGVHKLNTINDKLQECGFITVNKPQGVNRLKHYTTAITVHDPPQQISKQQIDKYDPKQKYEVLTPWLVYENVEPPKELDSISDDTGSDLVKELDPSPMIESLELNPLSIESKDDLNDFFPRKEEPQPNGKPVPSVHGKKTTELNPDEIENMRTFGIRDPAALTDRERSIKQQILDAHWEIDDPLLTHFLEAFLSAVDQSYLYIAVPLDKNTQKQWTTALNQHMQNYTPDDIEKVYIAALAQAKDNFNVGWPGALTKTMASINPAELDGGRFVASY